MPVFSTTMYQTNAGFRNLFESSGLKETISLYPYTPISLYPYTPIPSYPTLFGKPLNIRISSPKRYSLYFLFSIFYFLFSFTQLAAQSPYSRFLLGDKIYNGSVRQAGMGRTGSSLFSPTDINFKNPACLQALNLTTLETGAYVGENIVSNLEKSQPYYIGGISYFSMAFPINDSWVSGISMLPYTTVKYKDISQEKLTIDSMFVDYEYSGNGGVSMLGWANAFKIAKYLSVGLNSNFIFGSIINETISSLRDSTGAETGYFTSAISRRINIRDFTFDAGLNFHKETNHDKLISVGLSYHFESGINARKNLTYDLRNYGGGIFSRDTAQKELAGTINLPASINGGFAFSRKNKYTIAIEYTQESWSRFKNFGVKDSAADSKTGSFGIEWTPDFTNVGNYLYRMSYRTGAWFGKSPLLLNGTQLPEFGMNVGLHFPMVRSISGIQVGFEYARRGTTEKNLILEQTYRIYLGFSFSEKWFMRPKVD